MLLVIMFSLFFAKTLAEGEILQGPMNLSVEEGQTARFPCNYSGSDVPVWYIGGTLYVVFQLPPRHLYSYSERAMIVHNVALSDNRTAYRCSLNGVVNSATATLTVIQRSKGNFWEASK